jgi:hypothetical protein
VPALCYQPTILPHLYPLNGALGTFTRGGSYSVVFQSCSAIHTPVRPYCEHLNRQPECLIRLTLLIP